MWTGLPAWRSPWSRMPELLGSVANRALHPQDVGDLAPQHGSCIDEGECEVLSRT